MVLKKLIPITALAPPPRSGLIARPVSLAYYQHCRVIVVIFSFMLPLVTEVGEDRRASWKCTERALPRTWSQIRKELCFRARGDLGRT